MTNNKIPTNNYLSLGTQLLVSLGLAVYGGMYIDKKIRFTTPIFVWVLPLIVLGGIMYKIIKDTSVKK